MTPGLAPDGELAGIAEAIFRAVMGFGLITIAVVFVLIVLWLQSLGGKK